MKFRCGRTSFFAFLPEGHYVLKSFFHRSEKGFFRVLEVLNLLTADERAQLKITKSSNQKQILDALGTLVSPYSTFKSGNSLFIANKDLQPSTSDILKSLFHRSEKGFLRVLDVWKLLNTHIERVSTV